MFANWQFPIIENSRVDLFWNAASLEEMEPDVVETYLRIVDEAAESAFLLEMMEGTVQAARPGKRGVLQPTVLAHYEKFLPHMERVDMRRSATTDLLTFDDSFWRRR
jgi:hypothetical protein